MCGIFANRQRLKVCFAAFNLRALFVPQVFGKQAAFRFDHEVKTLGSVFLYQYGPVGVVGAERCGDAEPAW